MRIALVSDAYTPDINGVVTSVVTLQNALEKLGHDVFVITNHKGYKIQYDNQILRLPGIELKKLYGFKFSTPLHFRAVEIVEKMNLDIIHVHTEFGVGIFGRMVARTLNIPVVITYHTMYEDYTHYVNFLNSKKIENASRKMVGKFSGFISNTAQGVISPSEKTKESLLNYGVFAPVYVIPTGLDFSMFEQENIDFDKVKQIKEQYHINENDKVVLFVGRIAAEKSIDIQIKGMQYVENENVKLMIVGGGPQLEELKTMTKELNLEHRVIFTDRVDRSEIANYYACGDCFVSASLSETQGLTFIEAMAARLIVFARYDDVLKDLVVENESGYFFVDEKEFAIKVDNYFAFDEEKQQQMKQQAKQKVAIYDSNVFASKVVSVYYQAIDDYNNAYEVVKVMPHDPYLKITFENDHNKECETLCVGLDDYINKHLALHRYITFEDFEELKNKEVFLLAYYRAIKKICSKAFSEQQMYQYLLKYESLDTQQIEELLNKLKEEGYLNDERYAMDALTSFKYVTKGKNSIVQDLKNKGINEDIIEEVMKNYDDSDDHNKIKMMISKLMNTIKGVSLKQKKQKMMDKLIQDGFGYDQIKEEIDLVFENEDDDFELIEKCINKAHTRYQKKYKGDLLRQKVVNYCSQKGYRYDDIIEVMKKMEWLNEQND